MIITFGGVDITKYLRPTRGLDRKILPDMDHRLVKIGRSDGMKHLGTSYGLRTIPMPFRITNELIKNRRELARVLSTREALPLIFSDEPEKVWYALPSGDISVDEIVILGHGVIDWIIPDGVAYDISNRTFTNVTLPADAKNQVLDPEFGYKAKYYKTWASLMYDSARNLPVLGADFSNDLTIAGDDETKFEGLNIFQITGSTARSFPNLKTGDPVSAEVTVKIEANATSGATAKVVIAELTAPGGVLLDTHVVEVAKDVTGWQSIKLVNKTIKNSRTKALDFWVCMSDKAYVKFTEPHFNLGATLQPFSNIKTSLSEYVAVTNVGSFKAWPIIRAKMNGENGLVGLLNLNEGMLQFGNAEDVDILQGKRSDKVIEIPFNNNGDQFEYGKTNVTYTHLNFDPNRANKPGTGSLNWTKSLENVYPVYDSNTDTVWGGPTLYKAIPRNSANANTGDFVWANRVGFGSDVPKRGRLELTLHSADKAILSIVVRDSDARAHMLSVDFWINKEQVITKHLDRKVFTGGWFGMNISRTNGSNYEFKFSKVDRVTKGGVISSADYIMPFNVPELANVPITSMLCWFQRYANEPVSTMNWADTKFTWTNEQVITNVPNTFSDGDILEVDVKERKVYVNGIENNYLHALGNRWERFAIEPGTTTILPVSSSWASMFELEVEVKGAYL